jgi:isopenicillin N synthase-like dioxygenase
MQYLRLLIVFAVLVHFGLSQTCSEEGTCENSGIPIIDVSSLYAVDRAEKLETARLIGKACREIGFFVIINHGIDRKIISDAWNATADFFDLPTEVKMKYTPESQAGTLLLNSYASRLCM